MTTMWRRLWYGLTRARRDRDLREEMETHRAMRQAQLEREGLPCDSALQASRRALGNVTLAREDAHGVWTLTWLETLWRDARIAVRSLRKGPALAGIAILTLALGIGANTAIFSVINSVLLQPLPFAQPEQLVHIWQRGTSGEWGFNSLFFFRQWRDHNTLLTDVATHVDDSATLTGDNAPEFIEGLRVSDRYLRVLRVTPILGLDFAAGSDAVGGQPNVVILSHRMWRTRFHGDPGVINRTVMLNQVPHRIVGVLPASGIPRSDVLFLRPFVVDDPNDFGSTDPRVTWVSVIGRLKAGATFQQLQTELDSLQRTLRAQLPADMQAFSGPAVIPFHEQLTAPMRPALMMLLGVGSLLLLIACTNIASLLLVRATVRQKEIAVRMALGAGVRRIITQVLAESLVLSTLGAALAVVLTWVGVDAVGRVTDAVQPGLSNVQRIMRVKLLGASLPAMLQPHVSWLVLMYSVALAVAASIAAGLIPALRSCRVDVVSDLKQTGRGSSSGRSRTQSVLVASQIALATMLVVGSGLLLRSLQKVQAVDPGFDGHHAIGFALVTPRAKYANPDAAVRLGAEAMRRLRALPGIEAVGTTSNPPFRAIGYRDIRLPDADEKDYVVVSQSAIAGDYFRAMNVPLRRGRVFSESDNVPGAQPVIILSEMLAHTLFRDKDPIGQRVVIQDGSRVVVGIVGDIRERSLEMAAESHFYLPNRSSPWTPTVMVRTKGSAEGMMQNIRDVIVSVDPDQPVAKLGRLEADIARTLRGKRAMLRLVAIFALGALFLAGLGVYGTMAFTVSQRQREVGIRMALGASFAGVVRMVFHEGMRPALIGLGAGLLAAIAGARLIASLLFEVTAYDPAVFAAAIAVVLAAAALACWLPARRAARVDPLVALRAE
jgi:putative ABC transport system permease protein